MFQFPASPTVGQIFTPITGVSYRWNGTGWVPYSALALTRAEADALYLPLTAIGASLQVIAVADAGATNNSLTMLNMTGSAVTINPKSNASKLLVEVSFLGFIGFAAAADAFAALQLYDLTNTVDIGALYVLQTFNTTSNAALGTQAPAIIRAIVTNAVVTPRQFVLRGRTSHAAANVGATAQVWSITEIKT